MKRETVEQIKENPYLQYFIGLARYTNNEPFDTSMLVYFRQRINVDLVKKVNVKMVSSQREKISNEAPEEKKEEESERINKGKLI